MVRRLLLAGVIGVSVAAAAHAGDHSLLERFVQRAPHPRRPVEHTMQRAGFPQEIKPHSIPSITRFDYPGYIGGGSLKNNKLLARGPGSAIGPIHDGTFGTDFGGFAGYLGRVFLAPSTDPSRGFPLSWSYRAEGPRVTDVIAQRPLRKAILEKHEDIEERKHGKEGHGEGGHGGDH